MSSYNKKKNTKELVDTSVVGVPNGRNLKGDRNTTFLLLSKYHTLQTCSIQNVEISEKMRVSVSVLSAF